MKKYNIFKIGIISSFLLPLVTSAAFTSVKDLLTDVKGIVSSLYKLMFGLAMLFFAWSMSQVILKAGDPKAREEARNRMVWAVIALFVMFSIFGIITWIGDNLGIDVGGTTTSGGFVPCADPTAQAPGC